MKKADVVIGKIYVVKVSGRETKVRLDRESPYGGWVGTNLATSREVRIRSAAKLRRVYIPPQPGSPSYEYLKRKVAEAEAAKSCCQGLGQHDITCAQYGQPK
jgi:hypothetical protein